MSPTVQPKGIRDPKIACQRAYLLKSRFIYSMERLSQMLRVLYSEAQCCKCSEGEILSIYKRNGTEGLFVCSCLCVVVQLRVCV